MSYIVTITNGEGALVLQERYDELSEEQVAAVHAMCSERAPDDTSALAQPEG